MVSHHHKNKKGEYNTVRYFERGRIHITFSTEYCYNFSTLLLGIVVDLLLCLIHKLNLTQVCMYKMWCLSAVSGIHCRAWNMSPADNGGLLYKEEQPPCEHFCQKFGRKVHTDMPGSLPGDVREIPSPDALIPAFGLKKVGEKIQ